MALKLIHTVDWHPGRAFFRLRPGISGRDISRDGWMIAGEVGAVLATTVIDGFISSSVLTLLFIIKTIVDFH